MINILIFMLLCIVLGILAGKAVRREMQKEQCPYCSCRSCCNIGEKVLSACSEEEQKPFVCMNKN